MDKPARIGSYELLLPLARGGMGSVHVARRRGVAGFQRLVAIKRIHPHLAAEREFRAMMIDEARLSAAIRHPNVIPALDIVEDGDELALVLDYCEGASLSQLAKAAGATPLPPSIVARIVSDALSGLHAAHEAKDIQGKSLDIVHRNVSPQNVLVGSDGTARLLDFGVAKAAEQISVTTTGVLKGKIRYMSPEQVRRKPLDRRSDVFAAGVVLYEALCGRPPFLGDSEASVLLSLLGDSVPVPTNPNGEKLAPALEDVLVRALAGAPEDRFATAAEFQRALAQAIVPASHEEVAQAVEARMGPRLAQFRQDLARAAEATVSEVGAASAEESVVPPLPRVRRRWWAGVVAVVVAVACVFVAMLLVDRRPPAFAESQRAVATDAESAHPVSAPQEEPPAAAVEPSTTVETTPQRTPDAGRPVWRRHTTRTSKPVLHGNPYP